MSRNASSHIRKPVAPKSDHVTIIPLGGVGEVGKNCTAFQHADDLFMVDCGVKFPETEQRGVDLVIPDVSYFIENMDNFRGIVLTHGHEDHIGALPFVLPQLASNGRKIDLYGARLTLGLVEAKLRERKALEYAEFHPVEPGERLDFSSVAVEFIPVSHSIPGSYAIAFHTHLGAVVFTGDFKFDFDADSVVHTDQERLRQLGEEGVLALLSDCVRVEREGRTPSEKRVFRELERIIEQAKGRVIVTTFASNIPRMEQSVKLAFKHGRKTAIIGRSMEQNFGVAFDMGYIEPPENSIVTPDDANKLPLEKILLLTTGSQGEPTSALTRIASGAHPYIHLAPNDTVVLSAEPVPGNTETVARTIDNLFRNGAQVIYNAINPNVHVSGHASKDELRDVVRALKPRFIAPVHGEFRHQYLYTRMAAAEGYAEQKMIITEIGDELRLTADTIAKVGKVRAGAVLVDGLTVGNVSSEVLRDRRHLSADGVVVVTVVVDQESGELLADPEVVARGVLGSEAEQFIQGGVDALARAFRKPSRVRPEYTTMIERVKETLGSYIWQKAHLRPLIIPTIIEV